jgi:hypothetical protein
LLVSWEAAVFDFDPRDSDSRDDDRFGQGRQRADDAHDDDLKLPVSRSRGRDDNARDLGRGPGDSKQSKTDEHGSDPREDARWPDRDRDARDRATHPRDVFTRDLNLPGRHERQIVHDARGREYTLRGSESRTLATVGAFRVVSSRDVRDHDGPTHVQAICGIFASKGSCGRSASTDSGTQSLSSRRKAVASSNLIDANTRPVAKMTAKAASRRSTQT